jgi:hypothetical protein
MGAGGDNEIAKIWKRRGSQPVLMKIDPMISPRTRMRQRGQVARWQHGAHGTVTGAAAWRAARGTPPPPLLPPATHGARHRGREDVTLLMPCVVHGAETAHLRMPALRQPTRTQRHTHTEREREREKSEKREREEHGQPGGRWQGACHVSWRTPFGGSAAFSARASVESSSAAVPPRFAGELRYADDADDADADDADDSDDADADDGEGEGEGEGELRSWRHRARASSTSTCPPPPPHNNHTRHPSRPPGSSFGRGA